ncbi:glycosyltransferase [Fusobacterium necrophorum]|uniref:Glycosyltransferase 2-like domain-containing protein n=1 Tax=Fusobacterium necrophorum DJ-2 TaxID=1441737 RepID=A0AB73C064_9FUSO|nr:glycosyltransferase [Fusobacterium necrophorum]KDE62651.1 hypothetical protein FUSO4_10315 [Fusobacterium necrophorum DJ-1]KDE67186.1 hypothetical protein FUSO5_00655 [Fusobacterium necrophorum BFTR-1]KDE67581.1 hypothetical protein FUSO6_10265 [Fusobacterium necrophorum DAB]KDE69334.1 hypothetical protein FUSO8_11665 [Fusobacterium necrophorum DJ-2]MBR8823434.1 UDP-Gal:alpha-D-GlcNAc-diphosphoundecaprenol beta-1,3-galactosyltransferase [Fusobacterium necrophorum]
MGNNFSVLMSVYFKENPNFLEQSIRSIYTDQILKPAEIILVEDGALTEVLYNVIEKMKREIPVLKIIKIEKNSGLGNALKIGILECNFELIARMDTDDISYPERFQKQIEYFNKYPDTDVLGSFMSEFINKIDNIICLKDAPNNNMNMKRYMKRRDPVNHPSVMFKKSKVLKVGNYQEIFLNEDSYLWARMLNSGCIFRNIEEPLVYFRISDDTYKRRGGWKYIKAEYELQKKLLEYNIINKYEMIGNLLLKSIIRMVPNFLRKQIYIKLLRKNGNKNLKK